MKNNPNYHPKKMQNKALEIVKNCFERENSGDLNARSEALNSLKEVLIRTDDGSYTIECEGIKETMHTHHGGINESIEKYVKPSHLVGKTKVNILDICSGFGYTAATIIEYLDDPKNNPIKPEIHIEMVEISELTLATALLVPSPLKSHEIVKKAIENKLYETGFLKYKLLNNEIPDHIQIKIDIEDARELILKKSLIYHDNSAVNISQEDNIETSINNDLDYFNCKFDAIFLIAFSPAVSPELYSLEFLMKLKPLLDDDGIFATFTKSAAVRYALITSGYHLGEGPEFGRSGGTIASLKESLIETPLSYEDERMIALTDAGVPFRDCDLEGTGTEIIERRQAEREKARNNYKFASTVKCPLYLGKHLDDGRLKRRVMRNIKSLGLDDLNSPQAVSLICPQMQNCICGNSCLKIGNSRDRVIEMEKRLNVMVDHELSS
jgi:tRNA U34 5-methylaminomethyl-2-thiouridine-forming methyltransferase MnmC